MNQNLEENINDIDKFIKKSKKLKTLNLIGTTLICSAPSIWLIIRILDKETEKLLITAILSMLTLIYMTFTWCNFFSTRGKIDQLRNELINEIKKK